MLADRILAMGDLLELGGSGDLEALVSGS